MIINRNDGQTPHPGVRLRRDVIPADLTVTKAASVLGVSRPALSNLLNGKASLSADMAARLEKAFGWKREELLKMQAEYDAGRAQNIKVSGAAKAFVVPFLNVTANQIEEWATKNIAARARLSVLLRTLVNSNGRGLTKVDFPGNDDSQRPGWDGWVETSEATPKVPSGLSGWEFGVSDDIKGKADDDFQKSVKAIKEKKDRQNITFVFVTPRKWSKKNDWTKWAKAQKQWKDVIAYDASDIEQWLEQSIAGQVWFANETDQPSDDVRTLDKCWSDWADVTAPNLSPTLFDPAIEEANKSLQSRFTKSPDGPTLIAADSVEEALAFVSQIFSAAAGEPLAAFRDRVLVFDKPGVLPKLLRGTHDFIPVAHNREVEKEFATIAHKHHCIAVYPRNALNDEAHVVLKPIDHESFRKSLEAMGKSADDITRLSSESGHSLTVLRRRLATVPAIKKPEWISVAEVHHKLIPLVFVGAWNSMNATDQTGITLTADVQSYDEVEKSIRELTQLNDAPVWSVGAFRGVVSKVDALYASASFITRADLEKFFSLARMVLGEDDPSLDLPESERWAAAIHGKTREFSGAFRKGVAETFVLLAVHGNTLFKHRLGFDTEFEASRVVRELIGDPIDLRKLQASDDELPTYAEASPETFLSLLEGDLRVNQPKIMSLLHPASPDHFGGRVSRTGLLWALEGLCWNPKTLPRGAAILAQMSEVEINDNWVNKPINSLISVFRSWMPQTAADHSTRVSVVKKIISKFPMVGWKLCLSQLNSDHQIGHHNYKPKWRNDGYGFGEPHKTWAPIFDFRKEMVELALAFPNYTASMIGDLIGNLRSLDTTYQDEVWARVRAWARDTVNDEEKGEVREKIRTTVLSRRAAKRLQKDENAAVLTEAAKETYKALEPTDLLQKHAWLFKKTWVEESADDLYDDAALNFKEREERIAIQRTQALKEVFELKGYEGICTMATLGEASWQVGWLAASDIIPPHQRVDFLKFMLRPVLAGNSSFSEKNLCKAFIHAHLDESLRNEVLHGCAEGMSGADKVELLKLAPFNQNTWELLSNLDADAQTKYWSEVHAEWIRDSADESRVAVQKLLQAKRPRAAFTCVRLAPEQIDVKLLYDLLMKVAVGTEEQPGHYQPDGYSLQTAIRFVSASAELSLEQKAALEFRYLELLSKHWGEGDVDSIISLEKYIELHPEMYVQAAVWAYKRKDGGKDPEEYELSQENGRQLADRSYKLLHALSRTPGHDQRTGELTMAGLLRWVKTVRELCSQLSRAEVGDICIGNLLSSAAAGTDGVWPCEPVRDVLEEVHSEEIMRGVCTGLFNSRGVHFRGKGGADERELADRYRKWADSLELSHPFVQSRVLMQMVRTYEHDAEREDLEEDIRLRLQ